MIFSVTIRAIKVVLTVKDTYEKESSRLRSFCSLFECPLITCLLGNNYKCVLWYLHLIKFHDSFFKQKDINECNEYVPMEILCNLFQMMIIYCDDQQCLGIFLCSSNIQPFIHVCSFVDFLCVVKCIGVYFMIH